MREIRICTTEDLNQIVTWIDSVEESLLWAGDRLSFPIVIESVPDALEFARADSYCLSEGKALLGFGQLVPKVRERVHLARVIVNPELRDRGIGKFLARQLLELAAAKEPSSISLNVAPDNAAAIAIYRGLGFEVARRPSEERESRSLYMERAGRE